MSHVSDPNLAITTLASEYDACRAITKRRARNFYYGLRLTPEPRRSALYAIYAWMRQGDDIADDESAPDRRAERLAEFRARTEQLLSDDPPALDDLRHRASSSSAMWAAFAHTLRAFPIDRRDIRLMLAGLEQDMSFESPDTEEELDAYCARVASTVGRVCLSVWGTRAGVDLEQSLALATARGLAFQHTNILRDFAEDYDAGRVYLPAAAFNAAELTPGALRDWADPPRCAAFVRDRVGRAAAHYERSAPLDELIDPACAPAMWAMTRIYQGLLDRIRKRPSSIAGPKRIRLHSFSKASIAVRALLRARAGAHENGASGARVR